MHETRVIRSIRSLYAGKVWQTVAFSFCIFFGLAMIANNQLSGEATWFWYATLFHRGTKLYRDLHLVLQPLMVLEMDLWMKLFGRKVLVTEIPAVLHLLALCVGLLLLLQESDWPDWQKAIVLAGAFVFWTEASSYRFDDFHVTTEVFVLYSVILLLHLAKSDVLWRRFGFVTAMGLLCGFAITSRVNDGTALLVATIACLVVLAPKQRMLVSGLFVVSAVTTAGVVIAFSGDSFSDYAANTILRAAGSKGGGSSILADPFLLFRNALLALRHGKWIVLIVFAMIAAGMLASRYAKSSVKEIVCIQLSIAVAIFPLSRARREAELVTGLPQLAIPFMVVVTYLLSAIVMARCTVRASQSGKKDWDIREILILIPLAELASLSASAAADPHLGGYCAQMAVLLLLIPVIQPLQKQIGWANGSFVTLLALLALFGTTLKIMLPYAWENQGGSLMFMNRQWYRHPVYGPMYIQSDLLKLSQSICGEIAEGKDNPELLSLPFSYPNFFCDIPPWHGYVQTFFDISTRSTIERLIGELETNPPEWIVYQRQLGSLAEHERTYNHRQPLAQRDLDSLILHKIATGKWQVVETEHYQLGDGWYVIRTRP